MPTFNVPVKTKTGEVMNEFEIQALITAKPVVPFEYQGAIFALQLNPNLLTSAHQNRIQVVQTKLSGILGATGKEVAEMSADELRERAQNYAALNLTELETVLNERDAALVARAYALVDRDGDSQMCNYPEPLSPMLLLNNANLGNAVVGAVNDYLNPTSAPSKATGETKTASGAARTTLIEQTNSASPGDASNPMPPPSQ